MLGAGLGLVGKLFGSSSAKKERDEARAYSRQALSHLVEDAEKAGFNPLTVLRNGGAANYNAAAGFAPLSSNGVGSAISGVGDFLMNFDPHADTKRELEFDLIKSQIGSFNASALSDTASAMRSYPSTRYETRNSGKAGTLSAANSNDLSKPSDFERGDVNVTNPFHKESGLEVNPYFGDAAAYEERWGEIGGALVGLGNMAADGWQNINNYWQKGRKQRAALESRARSRRTGGGGGW